jgi:hypothetical protein
MIPHADSYIDCDYMKSDGDNKRGPAKEEDRYDSCKVEDNHEAQYQPIQRLPLYIPRWDGNPRVGSPAGQFRSLRICRMIGAGTMRERPLVFSGHVLPEWRTEEEANVMANRMSHSFQ